MNPPSVRLLGLMNLSFRYDLGDLEEHDSPRHRDQTGGSGDEDLARVCAEKLGRDRKLAAHESTMAIARACASASPRRA